MEFMSEEEKLRIQMNAEAQAASDNAKKWVCFEKLCLRFFFADIFLIDDRSVNLFTEFGE